MAITYKPLKREAKPYRFNKFSLRWISLTCLTLQTTIIITLYSYSRIVPLGSVKYLSSTVVVLAEIFKLACCFFVIFKDSGYSLLRCLSTLHQEIFCNLGESAKTLVPAALYAFQNNLVFYALSNLDPATYQVAYQLRILATAVLSILLVNQRMRRKQWLSLILLFIGVSLVQIPKTDHSVKMDTPDEKNRLLGFLAVIVCCFSSGFSGVYFERLIKCNPNQPIWIRNFQLALFCLILSSIVMVYQDYGKMLSNGFFQGYTALTWSLIVLQAFGGLLVAAVVKHADNVLKGFATSTSIILSTLLSFYLFDNFDPPTNFYLGASLTIISTIMYNT